MDTGLVVSADRLEAFLLWSQLIRASLSFPKRRGTCRCSSPYNINRTVADHLIASPR